MGDAHYMTVKVRRTSGSLSTAEMMALDPQSREALFGGKLTTGHVSLELTGANGQLTNYGVFGVNATGFGKGEFRAVGEDLRYHDRITFKLDEATFNRLSSYFANMDDGLRYHVFNENCATFVRDVLNEYGVDAPKYLNSPTAFAEWIDRGNITSQHPYNAYTLADRINAGEMMGPNKLRPVAEVPPVKGEHASINYKATAVGVTGTVLGVMALSDRAENIDGLVSKIAYQAEGMAVSYGGTVYAANVLNAHGYFDAKGLRLSNAMSRVTLPLALTASVIDTGAHIYNSDYREASASAGGTVLGVVGGMKVGALAGTFAGPVGAAVGGAAGGVAGYMAGTALGRAVYDAGQAMASYRDAMMRERWEDHGNQLVLRTISHVPTLEDGVVLDSQKLQKVAEYKTTLLQLVSEQKAALEALKVNPHDKMLRVQSAGLQFKVDQAQESLIQSAIAVVEPILTDNHGEVASHILNQKLNSEIEMVALMTEKTPKAIEEEAMSVAITISDTRPQPDRQQPEKDELGALAPSVKAKMENDTGRVATQLG